MEIVVQLNTYKLANIELSAEIQDEILKDRQTLLESIGADYVRNDRGVWVVDPMLIYQIEHGINRHRYLLKEEFAPLQALSNRDLTCLLQALTDYPVLTHELEKIENEELFTFEDTLQDKKYQQKKSIKLIKFYEKKLDLKNLLELDLVKINKLLEYLQITPKSIKNRNYTIGGFVIHDIVDHVLKGQNTNHSSDVLIPLGDNLQIIKLFEYTNSYFIDISIWTKMKEYNQIITEVTAQLPQELQDKVQDFITDQKPRYRFTKEEMAQINEAFLQENRMQVYRYFLSKIMHKYMVVKLQIANGTFRGNAKSALKTEETKMRIKITELSERFRNTPRYFDTHKDYYRAFDGFVGPDCPDFEEDVKVRIEELGILGESLFLDNKRFQEKLFEMYESAVNQFNEFVPDEDKLEKSVSYRP